MGVGFAQSGGGSQDGTSLFASLVPDASITIKKHPLGADLIEVTMRAPGYPGAILRDQIRKLGTFLGSDIRGLQLWDYGIDAPDSTMHFTKATFAVYGVIDRQFGAFRLNPFAMAFAGAKAPWTVNSMELEFQGEVPNTKMLWDMHTKAVAVEARFEDSSDPRVAGIEYRIKLLTQDASKFRIPDPRDKPATGPKPAASHSRLDWMLTALFLIAAGAVGALVYSLLLRGRPKARTL